MQTPPKNYKVGQEQSRAVRSARAKTFRKKAWGHIADIAIIFNPHTLREYCAYLNRDGIPTARDGQWTPGLVARVMKQHGVTAKSLLKRVTQPSAPVRRKHPVERYKEWRRRVAKIDNAGRWTSATTAPLRRADLIRHPVHGEGQAAKVRANGRILCIFSSETLETFEVDCPLRELHVFLHTYTREQRQEESQRIAELLGIR